MKNLLCARPFTYSPLLDFYSSPMERVVYPHFTDEKPRLRKVMSLFKEVAEPGLRPSICLNLATALFPLTARHSGDYHMVHVAYNLRAYQTRTEPVSS